MSGFTTELLTGLAAYLQTGTVGTWNVSGAYTVLQTGIVLDAVPQAPDRVITLSVYGQTDDPTLSDSVVNVQVRTRWGGQDPRGVADLDDAVFDLLHNMTNVTLSTGVRVVQCLRTSGASLGQDENRRWSRSSNYLVTAWRPSANRT